MTETTTAGACAPRPVVLQTHGLTKEFKGVLAVDHLDLEVCKGDVFGFLGPNGAGKTTTLRMILGLIYPTEGYAQILDHRVPGDRREALKHVGGFVEVPAFYPTMSARGNLRLLASMSDHVDRQRIDEVLDVVGLLERADSKVKGFSHGMKQRLGIAAALLHRPELVILDEPTSGLDPQGMKDVRELIRELGAGGTTVLLSSHLLHEVEQICNRAVIIDRGKVVVQGPVSVLRPKEMGVKILTGDQHKAAAVVAGVVGEKVVTEDEGYLIATTADGEVPEIVRALVGAGLDVQAVLPNVEQGLEDFFLELTTSSDSDSGQGAAKRRGFIDRFRS
jgi:ABC-2 type transport system ATP-binding protein